MYNIFLLNFYVAYGYFVNSSSNFSNELHNEINNTLYKYNFTNSSDLLNFVFFGSDDFRYL